MSQLSTIVIIDTQSLPIDEKNKELVESIIKKADDTIIFSVGQRSDTVIPWYAKLPNTLHHYVDKVDTLVMGISFTAGLYDNENVVVYTKNPILGNINEFGNAIAYDDFVLIEEF